MSPDEPKCLPTLKRIAAAPAAAAIEDDNLRSAQLSSLRMSQAVNINLSGTGHIDGRCTPCLRISFGVVLSPRGSCGNYKTLAHVKIAPKQCASKGISFICKANYNGHRRNPDFIRHRSQGFTESNNWKNEETDSSINLEHSGYSSVTSGLLNSLTSTPRFKVTETPGPKEKEIVELFRKIQAQLRERSTFKEQKKMESMKGKFQEKGTVDSLLKLLRRHSSEQSVRKFNGNANIELDTENHSIQNGVPNGYEETGFSHATNHTSYGSKEPGASSFIRPRSYFRRNSPISQAKNMPPANRRRSTTDCKPYIRNKNVAKPPEPALELENKRPTDAEFNHEQESDVGLSNMDTLYEESDVESSNSNSDVDTEEEVADVVEQIETNNFSTLKLADLRSIARSNGVKGFSKLKKSELVELLCKTKL